MSNLIDRLFLPFALVELVGTVEDEAGDGTDVAVGVHNAGGDDDGHWFVDAEGVGLEDTIRRRGGPVVPEKQFEIRWADEAEVVGLGHMLMGATGDAGQGQ